MLLRSKPNRPLAASDFRTFSVSSLPVMRFTTPSMTSLTVCITSGTTCFIRLCEGRRMRVYVPLQPVLLAICTACDLVKRYL